MKCSRIACQSLNKFNRPATNMTIGAILHSKLKNYLNKKNSTTKIKIIEKLVHEMQNTKKKRFN